MKSALLPKVLFAAALALTLPTATGCAGKKTHMHAEGVQAQGVRVSPSQVFSNGNVLVVKVNVINSAATPVVLDDDAMRLTLPDGRVVQPASHGKAKTVEPQGSELVRVDFKSDGFKWREVQRAQLDVSKAVLVRGAPAALPPIEITLEAKAAPLAQVENNQITIAEQIQFRTDSAEILADSQPIVDAVAEIMSANPKIAHVRIEGHTDNRGTAARNLDLSKRRAASVMAALVAKGISKDRLTSNGYGMERPIDSNATDDGRQRNRRVEFHIEK
ncbi:MAG: OmpA family protein [Deltaproteobacteria bacterium]|nr:OmpA family protein [Deltaproteobacteria bacterium]